MLGINKLSLQLNNRMLFNGISFLVSPNEKLGLVGSNGAGKSTLLKTIAGSATVDSGNISKPKDFVVGYLPQELPLHDGRTVWEEAESSLGEIKQLQAAIDDINHQLATREDYETDSYLKLIEDLNTYTERFNLVGGYTYHADLEKILHGLGFKAADYHQQTNKFSGGWRMRIELAKLLLNKHDVLLLDEPTNHLDINSIIWLENFLRDYEGAIIMVSHDRTFLDNITRRTVEIVNGKVFDYPVAYSRFIALRQERRDLQRQEQKNQEKEIKHTEELIERFRYKASKASFAQNLIKKLDKMDRIEIDDDDSRKISFRFPPAPRSGKVAIQATDLGKAYGPKRIFSKVDLEINRGEKIAFVGQNGQGKSTLIKIIAENLAHEGSLEMGHNVAFGYYAQEQAKTLDGELTVLRTIEDAAPEDLRKKARDFLGGFLFSGEDVDKKVKVLSGGEKGRLALCKLLLFPHNLLVMDEPTNHLDLKSKDMLKNALLQYDGTLVVVSHDRHFLQNLADKIFEFRNGKVRQFIGNIDEYLEARKMEDFRQLEKGPAVPKPKKEEPKIKSSLSYNERKLMEKELRKAEKDVNRLEQDIEDLEASLKETDTKLHDPEQFKDLSQQEGFYEEYEGRKVKLEQSMKLWEKAQESLQKLQKQKVKSES
jgi:ATP-binding cassette subfamily F protein 3